MSTVKRTRQRTEGPRLGRDDWLDAAFVAVVEGGFDKLRVLMIAKALRVTRGSFYWHFADHAELQNALLQRWRERQNLIDAQLRPQAGGGAQADLEHVLEAALAHVGADLEHMRFELALRGLGRRDADVAQLLAEVDAMRLSLFEAKFLGLTRDPKKAAELALLFYLAVVGCYQALARPGNPPQVKDYLKKLITQYLVVQQAPAKAARRAGAKAPTKR